MKTKVLADGLEKGDYSKSFQKIDVDKIIEIESIMRNVNNDDRLKELVQSIRLIGLINPITVIKKGQKFELMAGKRRLTAYKLLKRNQIPARVINGTHAQGYQIQYAENMHREDVTILQESEFIKASKEKLMYSNQEISALLQRSESYITKRIALTEMPNNIKFAVNNKLITLNSAMFIKNLSTIDMQNYVIDYLQMQKLSDVDLKAYCEQLELNYQNSLQNFDPNAVENLASTMIYKDPTQNCDVCGQETKVTELHYVRVCETCFTGESEE